MVIMSHHGLFKWLAILLSSFNSACWKPVVKYANDNNITMGQCDGHKHVQQKRSLNRAVIKGELPICIRGLNCPEEGSKESKINAWEID